MKRSLLTLVLCVAACSDGSGGRMGDGPGPGGGGNTGPALAAGLTLSQVALYQGVKVTLMKDGTANTNLETPVVQGRPALVRLFVTPAADFASRDIVGHLELSGGDPIEVTQTVSAASDESDLTTTINFDVPADRIGADTTISVSLRETSTDVKATGATDGAQWPTDVAAPLAAGDTGPSVKVVLVPVQYNADSSGRMPDTSQAALDALSKQMMQLYPVRKVELTVGDAFPWSKAVAANGTGWSQLLQAIVQKRLSDGVPENVYYYGIFAPSASPASYCGQGCVAGLSPASSNPDDNFARASIGLGFSGTQGESLAATTFVHEVGHAHGRQHAPCMVSQGTDPDYPYAGGVLGDWGYDILNKKLVDPAGKQRDMMGYCEPIWISDYNFKALFERASYLAANAYKLPPQDQGARFRSLLSDGSTLTDGGYVYVRGNVGGLAERITSVAGEEGTGHFYPFDHLPGGLLLVPDHVSGAVRFRGLIEKR
jgi:hypothetical protein